MTDTAISRLVDLNAQFNRNDAKIQHMHDLQPTLAFLTTHHPMLEVPIAPNGADWQTAVLLTDPSTSLLAHQLTTILSRYGTGITDQRVAGTLFFGHYNWFIVSVGIACFLRGHVPDLSPHNILLRFAPDGYLAQVGLKNGRFYAPLTDAPGADADAVATPDLLRSQLYGQLRQHMAPLITQIKHETRLPAMVMWGLLADRCVGVLIRLLGQLDRHEQIDQEVRQLLAEPFSDFPIRAGVVTVSENGRSYHFLQRSVCCLSYKLPGEINCVTCPLLQPHEQAARLDQLLAQGKTVTFEPSSRNGEASAPLF